MHLLKCLSQRNLPKNSKLEQENETKQKKISELELKLNEVENANKLKAHQEASLMEEVENL